MRLQRKIRRVFDTLPNPSRLSPTFSRQVLLLKAMRYVDSVGLLHPLSALIVYDTFLEFGFMPAHITHFIDEPLPILGGNEIKWAKSLLFIRSTWLGACRNPNLITQADRRLIPLIGFITENNWALL